MKFLVLLSFLMVNSLAQAQLDASSALLLPSGSGAPQEAGLESGRYKVKEEKTTIIKSKTEVIKEKNKNEQVVTPVVAAPATGVEENQNVKPEEVVEKSVETATPSVEQQTTENDEIEEAPQPSMGEQIKELILGSDKPPQYYSPQIHPDDVRRNRIEVDILPSFLYVDSQSKSWLRSYNYFSPAMKFDFKMWLTPFFGLHGKYSTVLGADVVEAPTSDTRVPITQENVELGVRMRRFYGLSRKAPSLEFSLDYIDNNFGVPADSTTRTKFKTSGLNLGLKTRIPTTPRYAWTLSFGVAPKAFHAEVANPLDYKSGDKAETNRLSLAVGGEIKLLRTSQMVWELGYSLEKNSFTGLSTTADPVTGTTLNNVSATQSQTVFSFGYRWGH